MLLVSQCEECTLEALFRAVYFPSKMHIELVSTYFVFEDVKVPVENLIGKENEGFKVFLTSKFIFLYLLR